MTIKDNGWVAVGDNDETTPVEVIVDQLNEMRPLPLGMKAFDEFADRIWSGALLEAEPGKEELLRLSVKCLLADEVVHLPGHQTHQHDLHFINRARKLCANQIALAQKDIARKQLMDLIEQQKQADLGLDEHA